MAANSDYESDSIEAARTQSPQTSSNVPSHPQSSASDQPCYLLELPAELRNRIYELVLLSPTTITVRKNYKPPRLLATSRNIRHEAWKVYFEENAFRFVVHSCDGSLVSKWVEAYKPYKARLHCQAQGKSSWTNLYRWLSRAYTTMFTLSKDIGPIGDAQVDKSEAVIIAAHNIVAMAVQEEKPWKEGELVLENFHFALSALDKRWV